MFGKIFKKKENLVITDDQRMWLEHAFMFLLHQFNYDKIVSLPVITHESRFLKLKDKMNEDEISTLSKEIAKIMEISPNDIDVIFFESGLGEIYSTTGDTILLGQDENEKNPIGEYLGKSEDGKYLISLANSIGNDVDKLISTISHELSHVKLLEEVKMDENNEHLTDIVPLIFGLGIFSANASFKFSNSNFGWSFSKSGYLSQMDWGYLLALYGYIRYEENPEWIIYLNPGLKNDFYSSMNFILNNKGLIFSHLKN